MNELRIDKTQGLGLNPEVLMFIVTGVLSLSKKTYKNEIERIADAPIEPTVNFGLYFFNR